MYNDGVVNKESFWIAYPELYNEIVRDAQLEVPSTEVQGLRTNRQRIAEDMAYRLSNRTSLESEGSSLPIEERGKLNWNKDPGLKEEFRNNFASYLAYLKQTEAGNIRIFKKVG